MISGIYQIRNCINGKRYIGSSIDIHKRWSVHKHYLNNNGHNSNHLQSAWNFYGSDNFAFEIIEIVDRENLLSKEQEYLDCLLPEYNVLPVAGRPLGFTHSEETKEKIRATRHTEEEKEKIRQSKLGKKRGPLSQEWKEKLSLSQKGKIISDETKAKMSLAQIGNKKNLGHIHSEETKLKMREKALLRKRDSFGHFINVECSN